MPRWIEERLTLRHTLPEWYQPSDADLQKIMEEGTVALDTNVLFQLYRLGAIQRQAVLEALQHSELQRRLWIPYQVAVEFQRNRLSVAREPDKAYDDIAKVVDDFNKSLNQAVEVNIRDKSVRDEIKSRSKRHIDKISELLSKQREQDVISYDLVRTSDPILEELDKLLREPNQVGPKPTEEVIGQRIEQASERFEKETPPGYADWKKGNGNESGDYLIWCEILDHAKNSDRPFLFVTLDTKEDWYIRAGGQTVGPRPELRREFAEHSSHLYHQTTLEGFLRSAKQFLNFEIDDNVITTVAASEAGRRNAKRLSQLRHPSRWQQLLSARELTSDGSLAAKTIDHALKMGVGEEDFNQAIAARALRYAGRIMSAQDAWEDTDVHPRNLETRNTGPESASRISDEETAEMIGKLGDIVFHSGRSLEDIRRSILETGISEPIVDELLQGTIAEELRSRRERDR